MPAGGAGSARLLAMRPIRALAVCTAIYPGVEEFLPAWYASLSAQTDRCFDLWIGLDSIASERVERVIDATVTAQWVSADPGATPAEVRQCVLSQVVTSYDGVVLVDSDDLLDPSRVGAARAALADCDLTGCALQIIDHDGQDLSLTLGLPPGFRLPNVLPRNNLFGLSNSAFRSELLLRCLPIPASVDLVDWFLATRAWLLGARLGFDNTIRMLYRQHGANMTRVRGPFTAQQVIEDTRMVRKHFRIFREGREDDYLAERFAELERVAQDVELFYQRVTLDSTRLARYVAAFNALAIPTLWWASVAYPALKHFWHADGKS